MTLNITPVVDTPELELNTPSDGYGATGTRFSTGWETAPNRNRSFTLLHHGIDEARGTLEGWNIVKEVKPHHDEHDGERHDNDHHEHDDDNGQDAFIIWSSGDKMKQAKPGGDHHDRKNDHDDDRDDEHKGYTVVQAAAGNSNLLAGTSPLRSGGQLAGTGRCDGPWSPAYDISGW